MKKNVSVFFAVLLISFSAAVAQGSVRAPIIATGSIDDALMIQQELETAADGDTIQFKNGDGGNTLFKMPLFLSVVRRGGVNFTCTVNHKTNPAWAPSTAYSVGDKRVNGGNLYEVTGPGTSAGSGGPTGTSSRVIVDNSVLWRFHSTGWTTDEECKPGTGTNWRQYWNTTTGGTSFATPWATNKQYYTPFFKIGRGMAKTLKDLTFQGVLDEKGNRPKFVGGGTSTGSGIFLVGMNRPLTVLHNGQLYTCITAHISSASTQPGVGPNWTTYWTQSGYGTAVDGANEPGWTPGTWYPLFERQNQKSVAFRNIWIEDTLFVGLNITGAKTIEVTNCRFTLTDPRKSVTANPGYGLAHWPLQINSTGNWFGGNASNPGPTVPGYRGNYSADGIIRIENNEFDNQTTPLVDPFRPLFPALRSRVMVGGQVYICILNHVSSENTKPGQASPADQSWRLYWSLSSGQNVNDWNADEHYVPVSFAAVDGPSSCATHGVNILASSPDCLATIRGNKFYNTSFNPLGVFDNDGKVEINDNTVVHTPWVHAIPNAGSQELLGVGTAGINEFAGQLSIVNGTAIIAGTVKIRKNCNGLEYGSGSPVAHDVPRVADTDYGDFVGEGVYLGTITGTIQYSTGHITVQETAEVFGDGETCCVDFSKPGYAGYKFSSSNGVIVLDGYAIYGGKAANTGGVSITRNVFVLHLDAVGVNIDYGMSGGPISPEGAKQNFSIAKNDFNFDSDADKAGFAGIAVNGIDNAYVGQNLFRGKTQFGVMAGYYRERLKHTDGNVFIGDNLSFLDRQTAFLLLGKDAAGNSFVGSGGNWEDYIINALAGFVASSLNRINGHPQPADDDRLGKRIANALQLSHDFANYFHHIPQEIFPIEAEGTEE